MKINCDNNLLLFIFRSGQAGVKVQFIVKMSAFVGTTLFETLLGFVVAQPSRNFIQHFSKV